MGPKYEHFKFELGQFVQLKVHSDAGLGRKSQVIERLVQECPGGVQLHYKCRTGTNAVVNDYLEIELEEYCEKDWSQSVEEILKSRAARKENRSTKEAVREEEATVPEGCYYCPGCGHKYWHMMTGSTEFKKGEKCRLCALDAAEKTKDT